MGDKFMVVIPLEDNPMTVEERRWLVEAHGYTERELDEWLASHKSFPIGGKQFKVMDKMLNLFKFTIQLEKISPSSPPSNS
jgi:hypothetical protein